MLNFTEKNENSGRQMQDKHDHVVLPAICSICNSKAFQEVESLVEVLQRLVKDIEIMAYQTWQANY